MGFSLSPIFKSSKDEANCSWPCPSGRRASPLSAHLFSCAQQRSRLETASDEAVGASSQWTASPAWARRPRLRVRCQAWLDHGAARSPEAGAAPGAARKARREAVGSSAARFSPQCATSGGPASAHWRQPGYAVFARLAHAAAAVDNAARWKGPAPHRTLGGDGAGTSSVSCGTPVGESWSQAGWVIPACS